MNRFDTAADDTCLLAFTSGTTGQPKATMHFHRDLMASCVCVPPHVLRANENDVYIGSPPLAFTSGLGGLTLFPMHVGASTVLLEKAGPNELLEALVAHRATVLFTAPPSYRAMAAGAKERRIAVRDGGVLRKCVPAGEELPPGTIGKLAVQGPTGCRYLDDARQASYVKGGWNYTGDAYLMDDDGYFHYQSRTDDMIVSAGYNIAAPEVEEALLAHAAVAECAVIGVADPERGQIVKAYVVLRPPHRGDQAMVKALQDFVKATVAPYKYPRAVEFRESLPRTETGKLQRFRLRG